MRLLFFVFILFVKPFVVYAQTNSDKIQKKDIQENQNSRSPWLLQGYFFNPEIRYERASTQEYIQRKPTTYAFALRRDNVSGIFEYSSFSEGSGNETLYISRQHRDYLIVGRYHFLKFNNKVMPNQNFSGGIYAGIGLGQYTETVSTKLSGVTTTNSDGDSRNIEQVASIGADTAFKLNSNFSFIAAGEMRFLFSKDADPNPQPCVLLRLGLQFQ
jgi:hypothetical protein